jgi:hypothetical protein
LSFLIVCVFFTTPALSRHDAAFCSAPADWHLVEVVRYDIRLSKIA